MVNTGDDEIVAGLDNNEIPERTQNSDSITTIKARETTYWTAGWANCRRRRPKEKKNIVDSILTPTIQNRQSGIVLSYRNSSESCYLKM